MRNFKGVKVVHSSDHFRLYRAVDVASGAARWVYQTEQSVAAIIDATELEKLSRFRHPNHIPLVEFGLNKQKQAFYVVEQVSGQTLAELAKLGAPSEPVLLQVMLQLCRVLQAAKSNGIRHFSLKPAFIYVTTDKGLEFEDCQPQLRLTGFGEFAGRAFSRNPGKLQSTALPDVTAMVLYWLLAKPVRWSPAVAEVLGRKGMSAGLVNLLRWCSEQEGEPSDELWQTTERRILTLLAGRHCTVAGQPAFARLQQKLQKQPDWRLLDCQDCPAIDGWHCQLWDEGQRSWQQVEVMPVDVNATRRLLATIQSLPEAHPGLIALTDFSLSGGRGGSCSYFSWCGELLVPLTERLAEPLSLAAACQFMGELCRLLQELINQGVVFEQLQAEQILVDAHWQPKILPVQLPVSTPTVPTAGPAVAAKRGAESVSLLRSLAEIAVLITTGFKPYWLNGELQTSGRFKSLPPVLKNIIQQSLQLKPRQMPNLQQWLQVAQSPLDAGAEPGKTMFLRKRKAKSKRDERKKVLLFLLLILLFQAMVNAGIIVIFK
ncbi:hypothetical protein [Halioxenophilus sp. WMMB6]|uniref:hypothetical protein n=1 Tax=Halioxenophilus sp. WMMB6 TaxID=3073815 RepID=UPI00295EDDB3|nr:hypothetical protein [Halioxenophilus sp. WMMB6]